MEVGQELFDHRRAKPLQFVLELLVILSLTVVPLGYLLGKYSLGYVPVPFDFGAFYYAALRVLTGHPLYVAGSVGPQSGVLIHPARDTPNPFIYSPISVLLFVPFALLPPLRAILLWNLSSLGLLFVGVLFLLESYDVSLSPHEKLVVLACVTGFYPTIAWLQLGQTTGLITASLCFVAGFVERSGRTNAAKPTRFAGGLSAAVLALKPLYAPAGLFLLRHRRGFLGAIGVGLALAVTSVLGFGIDTNVAYLSYLAKPAYPGASGPHAAAFTPLAPFGPFAWLVRLLLIGLAAALAWRSRVLPHSQVDRAILSLGFLLVPILSPKPEFHYVNVVVPVLLVALVTGYRTGRGLLVTLFAIILVQSHYFVRIFLIEIGPNVVGVFSLAHVRPVLPFVQPAVLGFAVLIGLFLFRTIVYMTSPAGRLAGDPENQRGPG